MKILQLAPLWETVPPPAYGGTEAVVSVLTEALVRRGHTVTLWASGDSRTRASHRFVFPTSLRSATTIADRYPHDWFHVASALAEARGFDLIHNHAGELPMALASLIDVPMLSTMHCQITADTLPIWQNYRGWYNTISHAQQRALPASLGGTSAGPIYNGIDVESFPFSAQRGDYLLFLSRLSAEKAPHLAIEAARRVGMRLVLAGKVDWRDEAYFHAFVRDQIDGDQVVFAGEADAILKRQLYRDCACLLLPLSWEEPFGLVITEAMACGAPVIAFPRGSARELVLDGVTGFLVENVDEMVSAIRRAGQIDPRACRRWVEQHFSAPQMVDAYLAAYHRIVETGEPVAALRLPVTLGEDVGHFSPAAIEAGARSGL